MTNYITVNQAPSVTMTTSETDNLVCEGSGVVTLTSNPTGAVFSGTGVSGSQFDPAVAGVGSHLITATYTDANGCDGTTQLTLIVESCLSVEQLVNNGISLQPNPNNGEFQISGLDTGALIQVLDLNGKIVYSKTIDGTDHTVKLMKAEAGFYYLKTVKSGNTVQVKIAVL
jgi:hypothetical protein